MWDKLGGTIDLSAYATKTTVTSEILSLIHIQMCIRDSDYLRQSRNIDLKRKMAELLTDLLVTGTCYYRVKRCV